MTTTHTSELPAHKRWLALVALVLPVLLISIDMTILGFAVPTLSAELSPTSSQLLWIVDIYSFLLAGLLIVMGTLGDRIGRRKLLLTGAFAFGVASLIAAYSQSAEMLIAARALLGIGGATLMPSTLSLIRNVFHERRERRIAIAVWSAAFAAGAGLGPLLGGVLLEHFWWGSVFLINVPVMLLLMVLGPLLLPESRDPQPGRFDLPSAGLSLASALTFVYGMKRFGEYGPDAFAVLWLAVGAGIGTVFVIRQRTLATPMINIRLFAHRPFSVSVATNLLAIFALVGLMFFFPQYLQMVHRMRPIEAGLWMLPAAIAAVLGAVAAAALARYVRLAYLIGGGLLAASAGYALVTQFATDSPLALTVVSAGLVGGGVGLADTLTNDVIVATAPPGQAGAASAISETAYELGGAMGIAILGSVASSVYRSELDSTLPQGLPPEAGEAARETLGAALQVSGQLPAEVGAALTSAAQEAFVSGMHVAAVIGTALAAYAAIQAAVLLRNVTPEATSKDTYISTTGLSEAANEADEGDGPDAAGGPDADDRSERSDGPTSLDKDSAVSATGPTDGAGPGGPGVRLRGAGR